MSLSSSLSNVGRTLAYYPELSKFFGSVNASIFFAQLHYWQQRSSDELGVYKTSAEWHDETGLSYREQATARKMLVDAGFMTETRKRLVHRVYFQLNLDAVDAAFDAWTKPQLPNDENAFRETTKAQLGKCGKRSSRTAESATPELRKAQVGNKTEITAEITAESTPGNLPATAAQPPVPKIPAEPVDAKETELQAACRATWIAYSAAYTGRYGVKPIRNEVVNSKVKQFVNRVGFDTSPAVAAFYVERVSEAYVVQRTHDFGVLLSNAEGYHTQWATDTAITATRAKQVDKTQSNVDTASEAMEMLRARRAKQPGASE